MAHIILHSLYIKAGRWQEPYEDRDTAGDSYVENEQREIADPRVTFVSSSEMADEDARPHKFEESLSAVTLLDVHVVAINKTVLEGGNEIEGIVIHEDEADRVTKDLPGFFTLYDHPMGKLLTVSTDALLSNLISLMHFMNVPVEIENTAEHMEKVLQKICTSNVVFSNIIHIRCDMQSTRDRMIKMCRHSSAPGSNGPRDIYNFVHLYDSKRSKIPSVKLRTAGRFSGKTVGAQWRRIMQSTKHTFCPDRSWMDNHKAPSRNHAIRAVKGKSATVTKYARGTIHSDKDKSRRQMQLTDIGHVRFPSMCRDTRSSGDAQRNRHPMVRLIKTGKRKFRIPNIDDGKDVPEILIHRVLSEWRFIIKEVVHVRNSMDCLSVPLAFIFPIYVSDSDCVEHMNLEPQRGLNPKLRGAINSYGTMASAISHALNRLQYLTSQIDMSPDLKTLHYPEVPVLIRNVWSRYQLRKIEATGSPRRIMAWPRYEYRAESAIERLGIGDVCGELCKLTEAWGPTDFDFVSPLEEGREDVQPVASVPRETRAVTLLDL